MDCYPFLDLLAKHQTEVLCPVDKSLAFSKIPGDSYWPCWCFFLVSGGYVQGANIVRKVLSGGRGQSVRDPVGPVSTLGFPLFAVGSCWDRM